jgi:hypothetical protein
VVAKKDGGYTRRAVNTEPAARELTVGAPSAKISKTSCRRRARAQRVGIIVTRRCPFLHDSSVLHAWRWVSRAPGRRGLDDGKWRPAIAFNGERRSALSRGAYVQRDDLDQYHINPVFDATEDATDEA